MLVKEIVMSNRTDLDISENLQAHINMGFFTVKQICERTGLEFHQVNAIMCDGELVQIEPEQKEKLIKLLYGNP